MNQPPEEFESSPASRHGRQLYAQPLAFFVPIYGTQVRQLKNWVALGRALKPAPQLPPLEDPVAMIDWWPLAFPDRAVPDKIHQAANRVRSGALAKEATLTAAAPPTNQSLPKTKPGAGNETSAGTARDR